MKKTNNKGFSLVELIVVIAIMAVLIAVLAPSFVRYVEKSRKSTDMQNAAAMVTAAQVWAVDVEATGAERFAVNEKYVIEVKDAVTFSCPGSGDVAALKAAFDNAGLSTDTACESADWYAAGGYKITLVVDGEGAIRVNYSPEELGNSTTSS